MKKLLESLSKLVENDAADDRLENLRSYLNNPLVSDKTKDLIQSIFEPWNQLPDNSRDVVYKMLVDNAEKEIEDATKEQARNDALSLQLDFEVMKKIAEDLNKITSVRKASFWDKVSGKEAVYIDLVYVNDRGQIRRGSGGMLILQRNGRLEGGLKDPHTGRRKGWVVSEEAYAWHKEQKTHEQIVAVLKKYDPRLPISEYDYM